MQGPGAPTVSRQESCPRMIQAPVKGTGLQPPHSCHHPGIWVSCRRCPRDTSAQLVPTFTPHGRQSAFFIALVWPSRVSPRTPLCPRGWRGCGGGHTGAWPQSVFLTPGRQSPQDGMGFRRQPGLLPTVTPEAQMPLTADMRQS